MKRSRSFLFFTLSIFGLAVLECLLTGLLSPHLEDSLFLSRVFPYVARVLAVIPPFLALGATVEAIRVRGLGYSLIYMGIYAGITLFAQIPLSLISYSPANSAPYAVILFSYMLVALVTVLLFVLSLLLGYAIFMQNDRVSEDTPLFSLKGNDARALMLAAALLTAYHVIREIVSVFKYLKDKMYIVTGEDLFSMLFSLLFFFALGVFCFLVGRVSGRVFPTPPLTENEGSDFI